MVLGSIDIVVPVLNEERCIRQNVTDLVTRLGAECPYEWQVTVVDNGSVDGTWAALGEIARGCPNLRTMRLEQRGRGRALKRAWESSTADVVAYMDVDLSTGLESLRDLIDPLIENRADLAIGSRLARGAQIQRSVRREVISRVYNVITRLTFGYGVRDAQCGFKAVRADAARALIPQIQDDGWFFDTELIVLAWRNGLRINEVPVRWVEDDDSRVRIARTAADDLRGIVRLYRSRPRGASAPKHEGTVVQLPARQLSGAQRMWDFDEHAEEYVAAVDRSIAFTGRSSDFFARRKVELLRQLARTTIGDLEGASVLDVGCGTGTTDRVLAGHVGRLTGIDVSEEMLKVARAAVPEAQFQWYDGDKFPFEDGSFDVCIAVCTLHHVPLPGRDAFLSEMHRVVRPGGLLAIFEHNRLNPLTRLAVRSCALDDGVVLVSSPSTTATLTREGADGIQRRDFLFSPFGGAWGEAIDRRCGRLPLGGQFVLSARKTDKPEATALP